MAESEKSGDEVCRPWQSYHTVFTNAKAGMEGVDKEKVQRIVYEMSKGSKYFENEERKEAYIKQKMEVMRAQCAKLTAGDISHFQKVANKKIIEIEATRDLSRIWMHVDMDAFYAAVETLSNPSLKGKPMAVGGMSMLSTANYEARRYGVRAAMPGFIARKLCPELIFVPVDFKKYTHYSNLTRKVFQKYDPNYMAASLDEAYLDITEVCKERGITSGEIAEELRRGVYEETGLTCSAGVAPNRLLAKVCSDINKPNGQFILTNDRTAIMAFISSLPIRKIGGIGKVTEHILKDVFGITTCEEMLQKSAFLCALFSLSSAEFFISVSLGVGKSGIPQVKSRKSMSSERTFSATGDDKLLYQKLVELAEMLAADMEKEGLCGRTLTLKLKTSSFELRTRAVTLPKYISSSEDILKHASKLLKAELPVSLRLMGLRVSQFQEEKDGYPSDPTQKTLSNFITARDTSATNTSDCISLRSDISDNIFKDDAETENVISTDCPETRCYNLSETLDGNEESDLKNSSCFLSNNSDKTKRSNGPMSNKSKDEINNAHDPIEESLKFHETGTSCSVEKDCFPPQMQRGPNLSNDEASSSFNRKEPLQWADDYKCSLCGFELPPSFIEERQEHSDFHMAERLQEEEESGNIPRNSLLNQRKLKKESIGSQRSSSSKKKKQKLTPKDGKHLPIDLFFSKSNQNF